MVTDVGKILKKLGYPVVQTPTDGAEVLANLPKAASSATKRLTKLDALYNSLRGEGASQVAMKKFGCTHSLLNSGEIFLWSKAEFYSCCPLIYLRASEKVKECYNKLDKLNDELVNIHSDGVINGLTGE